jgi:hypothetical protein
MPNQALPRLRRRRCREQTAGTYGLQASPAGGYGEGVLQTTNPARCARRGGESRSGTKIRRPEKRVGSTPTSGRPLPDHLGPFSGRNLWPGDF